MGYSLTIGNATPTYPEPSDGTEGTFGWDVETLDHPDSPAFENDANPGRNVRWPSYSVWADFAKDVGLYDLFLDKYTGLMRQHPGVLPIFPSHLARVRESLAAYRAKYPDARPRFNAFSTTPPPPDPLDEPNANLARLLWVEWWFAWALEHCEHPAMGNT